MAMNACNPSIRELWQVDPKNQLACKFPVWWETLSQGKKDKNNEEDTQPPVLATE